MERDVTGDSRLSLANPGLVNVEANGRVVARTEGKTLLKAEIDGQVVKANVRVQGLGEQRPFSFPRDIGSIFTKHGCNDSSCHGSVKGRGGLKLSLSAVYPQEDYKWIVEGGTYRVLTMDSEPKAPRINLKEPQKSLLLLKPTFSVPHGGGERFKVGSADYRTILDWIRNRAPYGEEQTANEKVVRVEVFPSEAVLDRQGKRQLLVTAYLADGRREDLTDQAFYVSNNPDVVKVSPGGLLEAVKNGETAVLIRTAGGHFLSVRAGVIAKPLANFPDVASHNFIDDYVFAKLRKFQIQPAELSSDEEFLRRLCLDLTGSLPPPGRVREFSASKDPQKREKLIEVLLNSQRYVDYWTFRFADVFRIAVYAGGSRGYWEWIRNSIAENRPYDQIARERVSAQGTEAPTGHYGDPVLQISSLMAEDVRVFMGRRLDCAQCHNHPFEAWSQDQFWGMAGFFSSIGGIEIAYAGTGVLVDIAGGGQDGKRGPAIHPRTKREVEPTFLGGEALSAEARTDPRLVFARLLTSHPYFAEAAVNRIWSYFFGRGIVHPVDDFRSTNPPTHPELLQALARDFQEHGYDLKRLMRLIVSSRTYQLSSIANETNKDDWINYSRALRRPLDAEVLLDAISDATGVPEVYQHASTTGGILSKAKAQEPLGTRAIQLKETDVYPSRFLDIHGRPSRMEVPERDNKPNLEQVLNMLAGDTYTDKVDKEGGRLDRLLKSGASDREIIEEFTVAALSRFPTEQESVKLEEMISQQSSRRQAIEDLLWGLITAQEFINNH